MNGASFLKFPPYVFDSDTSLAAADSVKEDTATIRRRVYERILHWSGWCSTGAIGATCDEIERDLLLSHQTCSPRVNELKNKGLIVDSGQRRPTRSGRKAVVYVVAVQP